MKYMVSIKYLIVCVIIIVCLIVISILYNTKNDSMKSYSSTMFSMDTIISMEIDGIDLTNEIQSKIEELNDILDRHSQDTQLYNLNKDGTLKNPSAYLQELISKTLELNQRFGNGVDITSGALVDTWNINSDTPKIPTDSEISHALETIGIENISLTEDSISLLNNCILDVGSVAKGYTLDVICTNLNNYMVDSACISMGSSTLLYSVDNYSIGIRSPSDTNSIACKFIVNGTGYISTSGGYERYMEIDGEKYSHILDLSIGKPTTTDLTSVTVYTDSGIKSDFLSTLIYIGGTKNIYNHINAEDYKIIAIDDKNNIYISKGLDYQILDSSLNLIQ